MISDLIFLTQAQQSQKDLSPDPDRPQATSCVLVICSSWLVHWLAFYASVHHQGAPRKPVTLMLVLTHLAVSVTARYPRRLYDLSQPVKQERHMHRFLNTTQFWQKAVCMHDNCMLHTFTHTPRYVADTFQVYTLHLAHYDWRVLDKFLLCQPHRGHCRL